MSLSIYISSAGSGKTYTLAKEYIKLLLQNPYGHPHILAVTFTNKATQEMKERILRFLEELGQGRNPGLMAQLAAETRVPQALIQEKSSLALRHILHHYTDFTILTIDSFFNKVIRAFAHELKLPLRMEVQLDTQEALEYAYDRLMVQLDIDPLLATYLTDFIYYRIDESKGWRIETDIKELASELFKESFDPVFHALDKVSMDKIQALLAEIMDYMRTVQQTIAGFGARWQDALRDYGLTVDDFIHKNKGVGAFGQHMAEVRIDKLKLPGTRVMEARDNVEKWYAKTHPRRSVIVACVNERLMDILQEGLDYWGQHMEKYVVSGILLRNLHALGLLHTINQHLKAYRDEHNKILISDQNRLIHEVVSQGEIPYLYEKTGSRYLHFLLDEFQDTSALQWDNFKPLLANALSEGGKVLVVGDGKQSIYRWRGGRMELLMEQIHTDLAGYSTPDSLQHLAANYRSRQEVIAFNNLFFSGILPSVKSKFDIDSPLAQLAFGQCTQTATPHTLAGGLVQMAFYQATEDDNGESIDAYAQIEADLLHRVHQLIAHGYTYGDLACLVCTNRQGARLANFLHDQGLPVQSSDSLLVGHSPAVKLIVAAMRLVHDPSQPLVRGQIIMLLHHLGLLTPTSLHLALTQANDSMDGFLSLLGHKRAHLLRPPQGSSLLHMAGHIVRQLELEGHEPVFTQRFLELVYAFEADNQGHLSDFLDWWDLTADRHCTQPQPIDAVTVLTIHRAKGLQFPVVLFPYADRNINPRPDSIMWWPNRVFAHHDLPFLPFNFLKDLESSPYAPEYAEELELSMVDALNMVYVAFTRAQDRLYVFVSENNRGNQSKISSLLKHHISNDPNLSKYLEGNTLEFGDINTPASAGQKEQGGLEKDRLSMGGERVAGIARPSIGLEDIHGAGPGNTPRLSGILTHLLLQMCLENPNMDYCISRAIATGLVAQESRTAWKGLLSQILDHEQLTKWRMGAVATYVERDLVWSGEILRPDLIYVLPECVVVIDFKTGVERPEDADQVGTYCKALANTTEWAHMPNPVQGYLLYTETCWLLQVC